MSNNKKFAADIDQIIEKYADMVYRLAISEMKNANDADDIFQEVFIRLVKHIDTLKSEEHIKAWLIRVTINCSRKSFINFWNKNVKGFEEGDYEKYGEEDIELIKIEEADDFVYDAVIALPDIYRRMIHLFYYEELSVREISELLGKKESTVKSQLYRGRELLREILKGGMCDEK